MVKTITIRDDVYRRLTAVKRKDESFSELFERLAESRGSLDLLVGIRGAIDFTGTSERDAFLAESTSKRSEKRD